MDKRVLRTRESIKTAFMQLMLERDLDKITVSDIAEKAKINRSTFYLHYSDVSAVIVDIDKEFAENISGCIEEFDILDVYGSIYSIFSYLSFSLDREEIKKRYIVYSPDTSAVTRRLKQIFADTAMTAILKRYPDMDKNNIVYPVTFAASGIIETYIKWCCTPENGKPLDEVIREVSEITEHIIYNITQKIEK